MIMKGDCIPFKKNITTMQCLDGYSYDKLLKSLKDQYERMLIDGSLLNMKDNETENNHDEKVGNKRKVSETANQTNHNNKRAKMDAGEYNPPQCSTCMKYHYGECWFAKKGDNKSHNNKFKNNHKFGNKGNKKNSKVSWSKNMESQVDEMSKKYKALQSNKKVRLQNDDDSGVDEDESNEFVQFAQSEQSHSAYMITEQKSYSKSHICADAGASITMTPNKNKVNKFTKLRENIGMANGEPIPAVGAGEYGGIPKALVVPDLKDTLISIGQMDTLGYVTIFGEKSVKILKNSKDLQNALSPFENDILAQGAMQRNGLYYFKDDETFLPKERAQVGTRGGGQ
jgi:hypothetical protein